MTLPTYNEDLHDFGIAGKGYIKPANAPAHRADNVPGTSRAAQGEGRYDYFPADAFLGLSDFGGGVGQGRLVKADTILSGIGDGRFQGQFFPARAAITSSDGGSTSFFATRAGTLYGFTAGFIETINSAGSQARTTGTIYCQPIETGAQNLMWVQDDGGTRKVFLWSGSGSPTAVTPPGTTPYVVCPYGRVIFCIGQRTIESTDGIRSGQSQRSTSSATNKTHSLTLPAATVFGNVMVAFIAYESGTITTTTPDGWTLIGSIADATVGCTIYAYYRVVTSSAQKSVAITKSAGISSRMVLYELEGIDSVTPLSDWSGIADATADTNIASDSVVTPNTTAFNFWVAALDDDTVSLTAATNYTSDENADVGTFRMSIQYRAATTDTSVNKVASGSTMDVNMLVAFNANALTTDQVRTVFQFTRDDGSSWEECFNGDSAGIPVPIAAISALDAMWVSTTRGMFRVIQEEQKFSDELQPIYLTITDVGDRFSVPFDTNSVGHVITTFSNFLYYPIGSTIHELSPNGQGRQIWPPRDWDTIAGEVQWMAAGEGGMYWGSAGYLWCYDGRGVHQLASEPAADAFDTLFWHAGRLYMRGDPARYFDFKYPSSRPDISYPTTVANFTTGYLVTSYWDGDKVDEIKIAKQFFMSAEWTATTNAGTLTLAYYIGDVGIHPERIGGGVTSTVTWTTIGTMTVADGNFKRFALSTPIEFKKIYLRVTIAPGSAGYPSVETVGCNARVKMPTQRVFTVPLDISTRTLDRAGVSIYPDTATVLEALDALDALRYPTATPYYATFSWTNNNSDHDDYTVTVDNKQEEIQGFYHDGTMSALVMLTCTEIPGA